MKTNFTVLVIGGGAAGLLAASRAGEAVEASVAVLEKSRQCGTKLLATGNGRCNFTIAGDVTDLLDGFMPEQRRFCKGPFYAFTPADTIAYFEKHKIQAVIERGNRVFPSRGGAGRIRDALVRDLRDKKVALLVGDSVKKIVVRPDGAFRVITGKHEYQAQAVVLATGGLSMARSGSTGDGYRLARALGHTVTPCRPSLVPLRTREKWPGRLSGLALKNVTVTAKVGGKTVKRFGEMLFTENGIGGPIILELSRYLTDALTERKEEIPVKLDLKPALDMKKLDNRLLREIEKSPRRSLGKILAGLMPQRLAEIFCTELGFSGDQPAGELGRLERTRLGRTCKGLPLTVAGPADIERAIVTRGGIVRSEVSSKTLMSNIVPGLFFAGEMIDIDGDCGGYNLQAAWSTGWVAGGNAAGYVSLKATD